MAQNLTRQNGYNQKNKVSIFCARHVDYTDLIADSGEGSILFVMPVHSIVMHVMMVEEKAANAAAKFSVTVGGIALLTNEALDADNIIEPPNILTTHIEYGGDVIFKQGTSPPTQGEFTFIIEYIEHSLYSGELTNFSRT